jgi:hypothetical protein
LGSKLRLANVYVAQIQASATNHLLRCEPFVVLRSCSCWVR